MEKNLETLLLNQELAILHGEFSSDTSDLLAAELWEIGADGVVHSRDELCAWLQNKRPDARWDIRNFKVELLNDEMALATYWAKKTAPKPGKSNGALHSSIWKLNSEDKWQMLFHQATKIL